MLDLYTTTQPSQKTDEQLLAMYQELTDIAKTTEKLLEQVKEELLTRIDTRGVRNEKGNLEIMVDGIKVQRQEAKLFSQVPLEIARQFPNGTKEVVDTKILGAHYAVSKFDGVIISYRVHVGKEPK